LGWPLFVWWVISHDHLLGAESQVLRTAETADQLCPDLVREVAVGADLESSMVTSIIRLG